MLMNFIFYKFIWDFFYLWDNYEYKIELVVSILGNIVWEILICWLILKFYSIKIINNNK